VAKKGPRPKAAHLRLVDGTHRPDRHGPQMEAAQAVAAAVQAFGKVKRPAYLRGHALSAWRRYIEPADWLDASREPAAIAFCELWDEFMSRPSSFQAAKHSQLRAYMNDLGLTDERNRPRDERRQPDEFFD
jgi:hypothetical protein